MNIARSIVKKPWLLLPLLPFFACIPSAYAGTAGSWVTPISPYTSVISYTPDPIKNGESVQFNFKLLNGSGASGTPATYQQIWIRILNVTDDDTLLATGLWNQPSGSTTLSYDFSAPGTYTLEASYRDAQGNDLAVASNSITIPSDEGLGLGSLIIGAFFITGALIGGLGLYAWQKRHAGVR